MTRKVIGRNNGKIKERGGGFKFNYKKIVLFVIINYCKIWKNELAKYFENIFKEFPANLLINKNTK